MNKVLKVGLTGGIGSGKTTVSYLFSLLGVPIYYADVEAKRLMHENQELIDQIKVHFNGKAYENGLINSTYLASIVFANPKKLQLLNSLVHPFVHKDLETWFAKQSNSPYAIEEAAILIESGGYEMMDKVIQVFCPKIIRINRVMKRDGITRSKVVQRMKNQMSEREKMKFANFVIRNDGKSLLISQVLNTHKELLKSSKPIHND